MMNETGEREPKYDGKTRQVQKGEERDEEMRLGGEWDGQRVARRKSEGNDLA